MLVEFAFGAIDWDALAIMMGTTEEPPINDIIDPFGDPEVGRDLLPLRSIKMGGG
jgi:hypothetical protein